MLKVLPSLRADTYFKSVSGTVSAGNFTYYSLITEGPIQVILKTKTGDADIYVSQRSVTPTYDTEGYCLHSATCGVDVIDIPSSFGRPVGIGVYGHPSHEESEYVLDLRVKTGIDDEFESRFDNSKDPAEKGSYEVDDTVHYEEDVSVLRNYRVGLGEMSS
ncbi:Chromosome 6 open reading frame 120 [Nesidiocoris tenuis]|uniref:Chromosome 6 open reading frame 120 n=1 Tax=Nesidiocoris tenuis TaxID=355587 RepID=A0ABN7BH03_9HEMI|nr:Chromosome 6 open reading frame 120 [Nesidiocoris tenuis]